MEWFWLEGTIKIILPEGQGHVLLDQVAPSPIQRGLEHFQEWGITAIKPLSTVILTAVKPFLS